MIGICALVLADRDADDTDDVLGDNHASSTEDEQVAATNSFNQPKRNRSRAHIDEGSDQADKEGVVDCV